MTRTELAAQIFSKETYLCVGLDTDRTKLPRHLQHHPDAVFQFNKAVIDATREHCVAYKLNTAFYEAEGRRGWENMEKTVDCIPSTHLKIADAKRGDIGNTSAQYAKAFFETLRFDAVTVAPYMGEDSLKPFLEHQDKWTIVLGLTSNTGANDFELQRVLRDEESLIEGVHTTHHRSSYLYETVLEKTASWGSEDNLMFVVGATKASQFETIRRLTPNHFYLVPGVGAQGGNLKELSEKALIADCGLLVNASRAVIYASSGEDFAEAAGKAASAYAREMQSYLKQTP